MLVVIVVAWVVMMVVVDYIGVVVLVVFLWCSLRKAWGYDGRGYLYVSALPCTAAGERETCLFLQCAVLRLLFLRSPFCR